MSDILVLGAGMVGSAMAIDMAKTHNVTLADISQAILDRAKKKHKGLKCLQLDVCNIPELKISVKWYDLVICAVPGF